MSYEKHIWETGEVITAEKLNNIERGVEEGRPGYEYQYTKTMLDEETVTIEDEESSILTYNSLISDDELVVTIDGVEYIVEKMVRNGVNGYGDFDEDGEPIFTNYPFALFSIPQTENADNYITMENDGTFSIKIESRELEVTNNKQFNVAVVNGVVLIVHSVFTSLDSFTLDKTWQEIRDAMKSGKIVLVYTETFDNSSDSMGSYQVYSCWYDKTYYKYGITFSTMPYSASSDTPDGVLVGNIGG